ncbi:MYCBP-associated protein-like [Prorops nasuta]|uniref:MYCBP-associated protein-like n=1 Tax=Prorops nasuta TaxID=863751 RepID=UPI0034CFFBDF
MNYKQSTGSRKNNDGIMIGPNSSQVTVTHNFVCKESSEIEEDKRLANWKKWLAKWKRQNEHLRVSIGRDKTEQILNSCEKVREHIEMRNLMEYATEGLPVIPDKYRGGPEFWLTVESLPNRGDLCQPNISLVPTKKQLNLKPELTFVGVPKLIQKEKGTFNAKPKKPMWKRNSYLEKRKKELTNEVKNLVEKEPEMDDLVIENYKFPKKTNLTEAFTINPVDDPPVRNPWGLPDSVVVLKIQDTEIVWEHELIDEKDAKAINWSVKFYAKNTSLIEQEIFFENKGNRAIEYFWQKVETNCLDLKFRRRISSFFFDKCKSIIMAGQTERILSWYKPRKPGVTCEIWKLITIPKIVSSPLIFKFWGCADVDCDSVKNKKLNIDKYLDSQIRDKIIHDLLEDVLEKVYHPSLPEPPYQSLFLEREIFNAKNPCYNYHPAVIQKLRDLYSSVKKESASEWNLSVMDLREKLLQLKDPTYRKQMFDQFCHFCSQCLQPGVYQFNYISKHQMVYNTLCSFFNNFETESKLVIDSCLLGEVKMFDNKLDFMEILLKSEEENADAKSDTSTKTNNYDIQQYHIYSQILYIRIFQKLGDTIKNICIIVDSFNRLHTSVN